MISGACSASGALDFFKNSGLNDDKINLRAAMKWEHSINIYKIKNVHNGGGGNDDRGNDGIAGAAVTFVAIVVTVHGHLP